RPRNLLHRSPKLLYPPGDKYDLLQFRGVSPHRSDAVAVSQLPVAGAVESERKDCCGQKDKKIPSERSGDEKGGRGGGDQRLPDPRFVSEDRERQERSHIPGM